MNVLLWHVHGSWTTAFVQGPHRYLLPVLPDRGPDGRGRARTWDWPSSVVEMAPPELAAQHVDVVLLQRPVELDLVRAWLGRRPGSDVPAVYVEHDPPRGPVEAMRHPVADLPGVVVAHVTWFNRLMWDTGDAPVRVIEHGVVDPGHRYRGDLRRGAVVINEPVRRGRVTGTDLLGMFSGAGCPLDLFGMVSEALGGADLSQDRLHDEMSRRRFYLHTTRWTSLGLSLVEAMHLGMPVVALSTTETPHAVPPAAGIVSNDPDVLVDSARTLLGDLDAARRMGEAAREHALDRFGLKRFLADWDELLVEVAA